MGEGTFQGPLVWAAALLLLLETGSPSRGPARTGAGPGLGAGESKGVAPLLMGSHPSPPKTDITLVYCLPRKGMSLDRE